VKKCEAQYLFEQINSLLQHTKFLQHHHKELEAINAELTDILIQTNQTFCKESNLPWSPMLHIAYITH